MFDIFLCFVLSFLFLSAYLYLGKKYQISTQNIRDDGPAEHLIKKKNTLTMGGVLLIGSILPFYKGIEILPLILYGLIGLFDDLLKIYYQKWNLRFKTVFKRGLSERIKFLYQLIAAVICVLFVNVEVPFFNSMPYLIAFLWGVVFMIGVSNAVNLTDGLDGLITVPLILCFGFYFVMFQSTIALLGAISLIPFLFFNYNPAKIFIGDVGSLGFGALLAFLALQTHTELYLLPLGAVFVVDTLSVILQVFYYKKTKKRLFLMAPIHHHFEKKGYSEKQIVWFVWIMQFLFTFLLYILLT